MISRKFLKSRLLVAVGIVLGETVLVSVAHAIVGAPLTPMSVGGVARRSTRRAVAYTSSATASVAASQTATANAAAAQSAQAAEDAAAAANQAAAAANQAAAPAPAPAPMITTLPAGCVNTGQVYQCGGVYYKPYLQGTTVVYAQVPGP